MMIKTEIYFSNEAREKTMGKSEAFVLYLQQEKKNCESRERTLIADERKDEANLCKIEANIYDIFETLYQTAYRRMAQSGDDVKEADEKAAEAFFFTKAESVPQNWQMSYEKAKEHQDASKLLIEETKLNVAARIMEEYHRLADAENAEREG